jgi:microcystin-dependent protein
MIPLPTSLSGLSCTRTVTVDRAFLYLVNGALSALIDAQYQQTGTLTVEHAREALQQAYEEYLQSGCDVMMTGVVVCYAGESVPEGWLPCDGSAVSRVEYANLFACIGEIYGSGDGVTTFNTPDLRGRTVIGAGTGVGLSARVLGSLTGEETHVLTISEMPSHVHQYAYYLGSGSGAVTVANSSDQNNRVTDTASCGGDEAHNNMQPSAALHYIIKT